jgi:Fe-S cluster biogenesis protein NfuA
VLTLFAQIEDAIANNIAPNIALHGGEIQLLNYDEKEKNVHVKLSGSCAGCAVSMFTIKFGVENLLKETFPNDIMSVTHEETQPVNPFYI